MHFLLLRRGKMGVNLTPVAPKPEEPKLIKPRNLTPAPSAEEIKQSKTVKKTTSKKRKKKSSPDEPKISCLRCGKESSIESAFQHFYKNSAAEGYRANSQFVHLCKGCVSDLFSLYARRYKSNRIACISMCYLLDFPFYDKLYETINNTDVDFNFGRYLKCCNGKQYEYKSFQDSIMNKELFRTEIEQQEIDITTWTEDEITAMNDCIEVVGYDPFKGYPNDDRKFLFMELLRYLDEDSADDAYKLSQILQIVNNNNQIKKYDKMIALCNIEIQDDKIKLYSQLKKELVVSNDKIAKENEISVKNRSNKQIGKNTLTGLMREMREKKFDEIEVNYYNQLKSEASQWAANMSLKAIQENCFFDENDREDIFETQRKMVTELQNKLEDEEEKNRLINTQLNDITLLLKQNKALYKQAREAGLVT